jgi:predicted SprT family Zn-dependent metalloprotease/ribosomal protein S27E
MAITAFVPPAAPTHQTYSELQQAYDHFNEALFDGKLPHCLITLQREKRTVGYFSAARFASLEGATTDEIAINPSYFAVVPLVETMQTLVHEMAHLWQQHFGQPGRGRYHNEEWAQKMESIGLMPSSTGQPGGKRTGDMMADYPVAGGRFLAACESLLTSDFSLSWYDRFPAVEHVLLGQSTVSSQLEGVSGTAAPIKNNPALAGAVQPGGPHRKPFANAETELLTSIREPTENKSNRTKYTCGGCAKTSVWGKPSLNILCLDCGKKFVASS